MYTPEFMLAFNHVMLAEVGTWFNPNDPTTQQGLCDTREQKLDCGYNNYAADPGGETKFGIAKNDHPTVDIVALTLVEAENIYYNEYWLASHCDKIASPMSYLHFDTAVNMGIGTAAKFLQTVLGVTVDGNIGPMTLSALAAISDTHTLCNAYLNLRQARYDSIVISHPESAQFAAGWKARNDVMRSFIMSQ